jgi:2-hydroxy-3-oxopropionate reductase
MVGGPEAVFTKCKPILDKLGSTVVLCGAWGAGNVVKLANQIMVAANIQGMAEALVLATKAGVDPEVAFKAVQAGLAGSHVLDAKAPMVVARNFKPGFRIRLHMKDINNTMDTARALNVPLPLTSLMQQILVALMNDNRGNDDHSAIVTYVEKLANVEVHKPS